MGAWTAPPELLCEGIPSRLSVVRELSHLNLKVTNDGEG